MNAETMELAREAVTLPGWRWMPGMLDTDGHRYQWRHENGQVEACYENSEGAAEWHEPEPCDVPDLDDIATRGCLLALVREAWDDPGLFTCSHPRWRVCSSALNIQFPIRAKRTNTEAAALVAALRAAPEK